MRFSGTYTCIPFEPEVLGKLSTPKWPNMSRSRSATRQQSTTSAGGPGSRSKASTVGRVGARPSESEGCSSTAASCAIQTRVGRPSQTQKSILPAFGPARTLVVFTHLGRCLGQRFSKKAESRSSTPSGKRRRVTARPFRWGTIASATLA